MQFLTKVQRLFHDQVIRVMLFVVVGIYLFNIFPYFILSVFIRDVVIRGLVAFVVVSLALKKEWLTAHVVIFLIGFSAAGANFINPIFSYNFAFNNSNWTFSLAWLFNGLAFVYLVLYFLTLVLKKPSFGYVYEDHPLWRYFALMFVLYLFRNSFNTAFFVMVPVVLVALRKEWMLSGVLAGSYLIAFPLNFMIDAFNRVLAPRPIHYFIYLILALVLLLFIGKILWGLFSGTKTDHEEEHVKTSDTKDEDSKIVVEKDEPIVDRDDQAEDVIQEPEDKEEKK